MPIHTDRTYESPARLKVFRLLIKSAEEISNNRKKIETDQQILIRNFQPQAYYSKHEIDNYQHIPSKVRVLLDEADVETTELNVKRLQDRLSKGEWRGQTPFGFEKQIDGSMKPISKILIVSFVFNSFLRTRSLRETRSELACLGVDLIESRILHLLKNGIYCGVTCYGSTKVRLDNVFRPVVTHEIFQSVQAILASNWELRRARNSHAKLLPLSSFVIDAHSGIGLVGNGYYRKRSCTVRLIYRLKFGRRRKTGKPFQIDAHELESIFKKHLLACFKGRVNDGQLYFEQAFKHFSCVALRLIDNLEKESRKPLGEEEANERTEAIDNRAFNPRIARINMIHEQLEHLKYFQREKTFTEYGMNLMDNIVNTWEYSDYEIKRIIQLLIFPRGILFRHDQKKFLNGRGIIY